ncbi:hypothetical protein [Pontibacter chinhatensis]|uniref:hypothetical protein n=1 Tax=Pontibacter chinhatensis TaxID=1436961 RepID=UPI000B819959|nr:hypothetical protein [Pontibacter chinhatensis]
MIIKRRFNLLDALFLGWYHILDKTIYSFGTEREGVGPREHSFFITFLFHGINVYSILSFVAVKYFEINLPLYPSLTLAIIIFILGYFTYFKKCRANWILSINSNNGMILFYAIVSLAYVIASGYFMLQVGDYVRLKMNIN